METSSSGSVNKSIRKNLQMKEFIDALNEYFRTRTDNSAIIIKKYLQAYSVTIDASIFDPDVNLGAQFYVALYELFYKLEPHSDMAWDCVDLLTNACRNCAARRALVETYQFVQPLSRLLSDQLSEVKKKKLLKLLQELTCGIKLSWQIPHLPHLLKILTKWVEAIDEEIVCLSLGVLVNICYKNLPAIYALSRTVDLKKFLRFCLPLQGPLIEVHVCKLMIIMDNWQGDIPKKTLLHLIEPTFLSVIEALTKNDPVMLRIVVDFLIDVITDKNVDIFREYNKYNVQISRIIELINLRNHNTDPESTPMLQHDPECIKLVVKLVNFLEIKSIGNFTILYPKIISLALDWVHSESVSCEALALLTVVTENAIKTEDGSGDKEVLSLMGTKLPVFLGMLQSELVPENMESCRKLGSLLQLLRVMLKSSVTSPEILRRMEETTLREIFSPILDGSILPWLRFDGETTTSTDATDAYVQAICLANELAQHDAKWLEFICFLMENRTIHHILARALYGSSSSVKRLVLEISRYPRFPMDKVALAMSCTQNIFYGGSTSSTNLMPLSNGPFINEMSCPIMTATQTELLDEMLAKFKRMLEENQPGEMPTRQVMELYEYKVASMAHAERSALEGAEVAARRCAHLQHRLAQLTSELNSMRQLLYRSENSVEQTRKLMQEQQEIYLDKWKKSDAEIAKRDKSLEELEHKLNDVKADLMQMTEAKQLLDEKIAKKEQIIQKLQENGNKMEKQLLKREEQIKNANLHIDTLNMQKQDLQKMLDQKESKLAEITKMYNTTKEIINTINKVASSQFP